MGFNINRIIHLERTAGELFTVARHHITEFRRSFGSESSASHSLPTWLNLNTYNTRLSSLSLSSTETEDWNPITPGNYFSTY